MQRAHIDKNAIRVRIAVLLGAPSFNMTKLFFSSLIITFHHLSNTQLNPLNI